jgi:4'-phosphopantetheinyl transferase
MAADRIYPVVLKVPGCARRRSGKAKVEFISRLGRHAVKESASLAGVRIDTFAQHENRAPMPAEGLHWSLSHKTRYVAGLCAGHPTGIDIEEIRQIPRRLIDRVLDEKEQELAGSELIHGFFRFWTAKEAVLKQAGVGLSGLSGCRVRDAADAHHLIVSFRGGLFCVVQAFFDGHVAAVVQSEGEAVVWRFQEPSFSPASEIFFNS